MTKTIKALSLKQPWLNWVRDGRKTIETRTWTTKHRGPLLLVASKSVDNEAALLDDVTADHVYVTGKSICLVELLDVRPMTEADVAAAMCPCSPGRFAWVLGLVQPIVPVPVRGQLNIFDVPLTADVAAIIANWEDGK